jgi:hypothetical protein
MDPMTPTFSLAEASLLINALRGFGLISTMPHVLVEQFELQTTTIDMFQNFVNVDALVERLRGLSDDEIVAMHTAIFHANDEIHPYYDFYPNDCIAIYRASGLVRQEDMESDAPKDLPVYPLANVRASYEVNNG